MKVEELAMNILDLIENRESPVLNILNIYFDKSKSFFFLKRVFIIYELTVMSIIIYLHTSV